MTHEEIEIGAKTIRLESDRTYWLKSQLGKYYNSELIENIIKKGWMPGIKILTSKVMSFDEWFKYEQKTGYSWYLNSKKKTDEEFQIELNKIMSIMKLD